MNSHFGTRIDGFTPLAGRDCVEIVLPEDAK
jgi:hypothetical protein